MKPSIVALTYCQVAVLKPLLCGRRYNWRPCQDYHSIALEQVCFVVWWMSQSEVRALQPGPLPELGLRSGSKRKPTGSNMSGSKSVAAETLRTELEHLRAQLENKDKELSELKSSAESVQSELAEAKRLADEKLQETERELSMVTETAESVQADLVKERLTASQLQMELEHARVQGELSTLRAVEQLRVELQRKREKEEERLEAWIADLKTIHAAEKSHLLEKISQLESVSKYNMRIEHEPDSGSSSEDESETDP